MTTKLEVKALVVGPLVEELFLRLSWGWIVFFSSIFSLHNFGILPGLRIFISGLQSVCAKYILCMHTQYIYSGINHVRYQVHAGMQYFLTYCIQYIPYIVSKKILHNFCYMLWPSVHIKYPKWFFSQYQSRQLNQNNTFDP